MVDDASAGALQLAFAGDDSWIDRSVDIARSTLSEINRSAAPDRWIAANITLGRALRLKAEKRFDPVMLREGIAHLTEALEALRSEPRLKLAESRRASHRRSAEAPRHPPQILDLRRRAVGAGPRFSQAGPRARISGTWAHTWRARFRKNVTNNANNANNAYRADAASFAVADCAPVLLATLSFPS